MTQLRRDSRPAVPTWVAEMEIGGTVRLTGIIWPEPQQGHREARVLTRLHGTPLGFVSFPTRGGSKLVEHAMAAAEEQLGPVLSSSRSAREHSGRVGASFSLEEHSEVAVHSERQSPITVVVCTRDRPDHLKSCLPRLMALSYDRYEVLVVDNAPSDGATHDQFTRSVGADPRFRYVVEPLPGLSRARNRGLHEARHTIVAFTDDDALVDTKWLSAIASGFARNSNVACVTGLVAAAELDTAAQHYFDRHSGWGRRLEPRLFDIDAHRDPAPWYPFSPGICGAGANFAVDRRFITAIGGFDPLLGAGAPGKGGEDLDIFLRIILRGRSIAYEPGALVWHVHRATDVELAGQLFSWGAGCAAYVVKQVLERDTRAELLRRTPKLAAHIARLWSSAAMDDQTAVGGAPFSAVELRGMAAGTLAYLRARYSRSTTITDRR